MGKFNVYTSPMPIGACCGCALIFPENVRVLKWWLILDCSGFSKGLYTKQDVVSSRKHPLISNQNRPTKVWSLIFLEYYLIIFGSNEKK